jgi:class 3 adenylate cyclase
MTENTEPPPTPRRSATEWLAEVRRYESDAELFLAYDLARQGLEQFPQDLRLKHRAVLCLASTGARERAREEFRRLGLDGAMQLQADAPPSFGFDIASLDARLLKDEAIDATTDPERTEKLIRAAIAYDAIYRRMQAAGDPESYYPGINCATLRLLAGDNDRAEELAREIRQQLLPRPARKKNYYEIATELEATLILGDLVEATRLVRLILARIKGSEHDYRALASTIRQLRLVAKAKQMNPNTLAELGPPRVIHYLGHIISPPGGRGRFPANEAKAVQRQIVERMAADDIGFAYGSLAAGADILFAESALERGASLNIVLPFTVEEFIDVSVRPAGDDWVERFNQCFEAAATKRFATTGRYLGDDSLFGYCSQLAMGFALLRANDTCAPVEQMAVWDGKPAAGPVGTAVDIGRWKKTRMPQTIIAVSGNTSPAPVARRCTERRTRAMLFGDVKGFSKLTDEQLPRFVEIVLGAFARVIDDFRGDIQLVNTWGDGLFLVFEDGGKAAGCALALQDVMNGIDLTAAGMPDTMGLRLGGHLGPVYAARDPILHSTNFFGADVSRAARIEPVTPEKLVYVTEALAAVLALHNADEFECSYVGMTKAAKEYGEMRMFLLSRKAALTAGAPIT